MKSDFSWYKRYQREESGSGDTKKKVKLFGHGIEHVLVDHVAAGIVQP
jgi:hypothetical protein